MGNSVDTASVTFANPNNAFAAGAVTAKGSNKNPAVAATTSTACVGANCRKLMTHKSESVCCCAGCVQHAITVATT